MRFLVFIVFIGLLVACESQPKIDYNKQMDTVSVLDDRLNDTTKVAVADLPVQFDSTNVLIFGIRLVTLNERNRGSIKGGSSGYDSYDVASSYYDSERDQMPDSYINLVFRISGKEDSKLTDHKLYIKSVQFLREVYRKTGSTYLLYTVADRDSDGDGEMGYNDLGALYISNLDGTEFRKLTKELQEFYDSRYIKGENRIYYRTLEDNNRDGNLNSQDKFRHYFIDFNNDGYKVTEHYPATIFEK